MTYHTSLITRLVKLKTCEHGSIRISLVLEENELDTCISGEVPVPKGGEAKALHKKNLAKNIIADSIKDHLIPQVSSLKTPKEMFDSLTRYLKGRTLIGR